MDLEAIATIFAMHGTNERVKVLSDIVSHALLSVSGGWKVECRKNKEGALLCGGPDCLALQPLTTPPGSLKLEM